MLPHITQQHPIIYRGIIYSSQPLVRKNSQQTNWGLSLRRQNAPRFDLAKTAPISLVAVFALYFSDFRCILFKF